MLSYSKLLTGIATVFVLNFPLAIASATPLNDSSQIAAKVIKLEGTSWQLMGWGQLDNLTSPLGNTTITLEFQAERLTGSGGCNRYNAGYEVENYGITLLTPFAATRKACPPDIMQQESQYFNYLSKAQTYRINSQGQLEIETSEGLLVFDPQFGSNGATSWLDSQKPQNWNQAGASISKAPDTGEGNNLEYCQKQVRKPSTPEDQALVKAGWSLFGAVQVYGDTSVISAMSNADGMCRPMGYQEFVFVDSKFAGTLSPIPMNSRTEGSAVNTYLTSENSINTIFNRYSDQDALCCPSRTSNVSYIIIENERGMPVVVPQEVYPKTTSHSHFEEG